MKKHLLIGALAAAVLLTAGCQKDPPEPTSSTPPATSGIVQTEPTAAHGWSSGESPVPEKRVGFMRAGLCNIDHAVSPTGIYFIEADRNGNGSYLRYADNGSDTFIKLCGRPDCPHGTPDCNAYLHKGSDISFYGGYLYAVTGEGAFSDQCKLVRMDPDGANHVTVLDLMAFAAEHEGTFVICDRITEGVCLFSVYGWEKTSDDPDSNRVQDKHLGYYYYKLDGSMEAPEAAHTGGMACYSCGDVFLTYFPMSYNGGTDGSYWDWDPDTNAATYLTDHPGQPGWFGPETGYYFKDGAICRLTYATQTEEIMVDTGLEGDYYAYVLPDCIVVSTRSKTSADKNLYFYNWSFELIDTVRISYPLMDAPEFAIAGETAERILLSDQRGAFPKYYINKAELGSGSVEIHPFDLA